MARAACTSILALALATGCPSKPNTFTAAPDIGPPCDPGFVFRFGQCYCTTDLACPDPVKMYCDSATGTCLPRKGEPPADASFPTCVTGALRCAPAPAKSIEECTAGAWTVQKDCSDGICMASATGYFCTVCAPGLSRCKDAATAELCSENGDKWIEQPCPVLASGQAHCDSTACQVCTGGQTRCNEDNTSLETCAADGLSWQIKWCDYTGKCDPAKSACVAPVCTPGDRKCAADGVTLSTCSFDGSGYVDQDCRHVDQNSTPTAICQNNNCVDPCAEAARNKSYEGCDYWAVVLSNPVDKAFKGKTTDGTQSDTTSEFALVVSNQNANPVHVKVMRKKGATEQVSPMNPAPAADGTYSIPANGLATLRLPWQQVNGSGQAGFGYHLTSDLPISVYQFNPVTSSTGGIFSTESYTNDASLLLPSHILSKSYVVVGQEHLEGVDIWDGVDPYPALMAVVATEDNTSVTIRFAATTLANPSSGGNGTIAAQPMGSTNTFVLNKYDVLQFLSDHDTGAPAECHDTPMYEKLSSPNTPYKKFCRYHSDTTGSIVTATKPVAVFGGADCTLKPFDRMACDHVEEEMMPFETWGKSYVGVRSHAYKDSNGDDVSGNHRSPDYWRVVSGCGKTDCPNGTHVTINPAPKAYLPPAGALYCPTGGGDCVLPPIDVAAGVVTAPVLEFMHEGDFVVTADLPVMLAQYLTSEDANRDPNFDPTQPPSSGDSAEGDPSLILAAPVEQWRTSYHVLASPTMSHNYLNLAVKSAAPSITIDGKALSKFSNQSATVPGGFIVYRVTVGQGQHTILSPDPVGVTVYGYDEYVSYGYTGGLDLHTITVIVPGG